MSFSPGEYKTKAGHRAIVTRLVAKGLNWVYQGAIEDKDCPKVLHIHHWQVNGYSRLKLEVPELDSFDLVPHD